MHCHCGTNNRAPRWTFTDPCKPEVRPGIRNNTIGRLTIPYNIETLLKGCNLYSEADNRDIFLAVQNFILKSNRFD